MTTTQKQRIAFRLLSTGMGGVLRFDRLRPKRAPFGANWRDDVAAVLGTPATVVDVGANIGQTVLAVKQRFPRTVIHSFEPVSSTYRTLVQNVSSIDGVHTYRKALGARTGAAMITAAADDEQNTLHVETQPDAQTEVVEIDTVDAFLDRAQLDVVDLLKIDTEGFDLEVLRGAEKTLTDGRIKLVLAECDFNNAGVHTNFDALLTYLYPLGYRVVSFYCSSVGPSGWIWGDVLFMKPLDDGTVRFRHRRRLLS